MCANRIDNSQSPSSGRFIVNFNGVEKRISLKQNKGDYTIDRLKKKVFAKFKKLGTIDFDIKMNDGISILTDNDIILFLLGQNDPLPKCNVFVGMPRFDMESVSKSDDDDDDSEEPQPQQLQPRIHNHLYLKQSHSEQRHNTYSPISPLPRAISFDITDNNNVIDIYDGHKEYICCFKNTIKKMMLTMFDIAKYTDVLFNNKFLSEFDYKLGENELLQLDVYDVLTKQYIDIKLPLWSYDSKHYHIKGEIVNRYNEEEYDEEEESQQENENDHDEQQQQNIFDSLEIDLNLQQKEFEEMICSIDMSAFDNNNSNNNIYLWKKYQSDAVKIENDIILFINTCYERLDKGIDLYNGINVKCMKLKEICSNELNIINKLQHGINCDKLEIIEIEKAIRRLTIQKMKYKQSLKTKQIQIKKEENILNKSQNKLQKLKYFENKYEVTKKQLNINIQTFKNDKQIKINNVKKHLNKIWKTFELNYFQWNIEEALQWILCIENLYFSDSKFNNFIQTLKKHQFCGKNLKELKSNFTLNVMGLLNTNDQQILIKNINRIINKSHRKPIHNNNNNNKKNSTNNNNSDATGNLCCICADKEINTVIIPCGHMVYCSNCSKGFTITTCPTCRTKNVNIILTYKSGL